MKIFLQRTVNYIFITCFGFCALRRAKGYRFPLSITKVLHTYSFHFFDHILCPKASESELSFNILNNSINLNDGLTDVSFPAWENKEGYLVTVNIINI